MALPIGDLSRSDRFPFATVGLVLANVAVWAGYQLPTGVDRSVGTIGLHPCTANGSCSDIGVPWPLDAMTAAFGHASWAHLVGNMVFLLVFGRVVEGRLGIPRYLSLYLLSAVAASALQIVVTLTFVPGDDHFPNIGASGAISGVIAAYVVALPFERILVWVMPMLFVRIPAIALLGVWFVLQALEGSLAVSNPDVQVGVAFFAHVGGFMAGLALATLWLPDAWTRVARRSPSAST